MDELLWGLLLCLGQAVAFIAVYVFEGRRLKTEWDWVNSAPENYPSKESK